jgi:glucosamine-6-phosphate deaminase
MSNAPCKQEQVGNLRVNVYDSRMSLGAAAAAEAADEIRERLARQEGVRIVFAAAPSQNEFLAALVKEPGIDWSRVTAFHMDEYIGLPADAPQRFSRFLWERVFDIVRPGEVHVIDGTANSDEECRRYAGLIGLEPIDVVCLGIGENGHIAFNDPPVADFQDPAVIKPVELDLACRQQQVNDGCFPHLAAVPTHALTLTIPTLMSGGRLFCMVPGPAKRDAVRSTLRGPIAPECPASILRRHEACTLYLDRDSYGG